MSRLSRAEAEIRLQNPDGEFIDVLARLPSDVDSEVASKALLTLFGQGRKAVWLFARHCQRLPAPVIRALLRRLSEERPLPAHAIFLVEAMADTKEPELPAAWRRALEAQLDLETSYAWGSKQRKQKLKALAQSPRMLSAIQAAAVGSTDATMDMLAVLAADGSEASVDALLPWFAREDVGDLERLRTHAAKTPAMEAMLGAIDERRGPALAFARSRGFQGVIRLVGEARFLGAFAASYEAELTIDSAKPAWMTVKVAPRHRPGAAGTAFTNAGIVQDDLALGSCAAEELPGWLAQAQQKLGIRWAANPEVIGDFVIGDFTGKKRDRDGFVTWLLAASRR